MADGSTFPHTRPSQIGPATEARIMAAFAEKAMLTAEETAGLLGNDVKSLRALTDAGIIRAVRRGGGGHRAYTEGDIRSYLTESVGPIREVKPKTRHQNHGVVPFSQRKGQASR